MLVGTLLPLSSINQRAPGYILRDLLSLRLSYRFLILASDSQVEVQPCTFSQQFLKAEDWFRYARSESPGLTRGNAILADIGSPYELDSPVVPVPQTALPRCTRGDDSAQAEHRQPSPTHPLVGSRQEIYQRIHVCEKGPRTSR